jgi:2,3-bisphosphoglycerate-independent phosphoglycerate mutase
MSLISHKYVVIIGDGMADYPIKECDNKTIVEFAKTPVLDTLSKKSVIGLARTVPEGMPPGSDTANLSIFSYNPKKYYTGRAPLEALNQGIELGPRDVAFRCNIVSIKDGVMDDFTADHISQEFAALIMKSIDELGLEDLEFYPGVSYRNLLVWRNYPGDSISETTPPHDIQGEQVASYLPKGESDEVLKSIMEKARPLISELSQKHGQLHGDPTDLWIWGGGFKPDLVSFEKKFGVQGATISAVDLIHGIGVAAGLTPVFVEGATGYIDTNYAGKVEAAFNILNEKDFVFVHIEAPDESGHEGSIAKKLQSVEDLDSKVIAPIVEGLGKYENYSLLIMPDHPTPIVKKTHVSDPVPFLLYSTEKSFKESIPANYSFPLYGETEAAQTGIMIEDGSTLLDIMICKQYSGLN